ncbi:MAG: hypothetical protein KJ882_10290 [Proteobacteria bacterium]|nr:hypothetical protein [Pseudomonadota bacterium]MBU4011143.1 hypothetical protein [Pseudomonadota bacterium]MBU4034809.1 hypothetical protein [Pseudomonadota bacterium]
MFILKNKMNYIYCMLILLISASSYAGEIAKYKHYEYAEFVVVNRFYDESGGIAGMSTTVYFNDGSDKVITSYSKESVIAQKDAKIEAFKDFIEKYTNKKITSSKVSEMKILNILSSNGWEVIHYDNKTLTLVEGSGSKARYLLRKEAN